MLLVKFIIARESKLNSHESYEVDLTDDVGTVVVTRGWREWGVGGDTLVHRYITVGGKIFGIPPPPPTGQ